MHSNRRGITALLIALAIGLPLAVAASTAAGGEYRLGALLIGQPWMRATPKGARVAGGFLKISNTGSLPDRLIGGSLVAAGRVEVHEMAVVGGIMRMRELERGLDILPGQTVALEPGSSHLMFRAVRQPLSQGDLVAGTLVFEKAGTIKVEFRVEAIGSRSHGSHGGHGGKQ